jgi:antirestriction protein ArdC
MVTKAKAKPKFDKFLQDEMKDHHQILTDRIIEKMEESIKFEKPWFNCDMFPYNPVTKTVYKGVNVISLLANGFDDPRFLTFNNIQTLSKELGTPILIKKDEKGTSIFKAVKRTFVTEDKDTQEKVSSSYWQYVYAGKVFNASQLTGMPPLPAPKGEPFKTEEEVEKILKAMCEETGLKFEHRKQDRAYYQPTSDTICIPPKESFKSPMFYYSTLMHELGHSTGHEKRLNRKLTGQFQSPEYAYEELIAELSAYYMGATLNLPYDSKTHDNHAGYLKSWIKALKDDKNMIFKAASQASKAVAFQINTKKLHFGELIESTEENDEAQENEPVKVAKIKP